MKNASLAAILATTGAFALLVPVSAFAQAAPAPAPDSAPVAASAPSDQAPTPAAAAAPAPEPLPWAGSSMFAQFSVPTNEIFRGQQQTPDNSLNFWVRLQPRWKFNKQWQLRAAISGSGDIVEGVNTSTTYKHEFLLNDPVFTLFYTDIPKLPGDVKMLAGVTLRLPLSKTSWAQTLIAAPGLTMQFAKGFSSMGGDTLLVASGSYSRPIYQSLTPIAPDSLPYPRATYVAGQTGGLTDDQFTGSVNTRDGFSLVAFAVQTWGKWSPGLFLLESAALPYQLKDLSLNQTNVASYHIRSSTYFGAWLDYEVNDWFTPELGYQMSRSVLNSDGTWGNPFFGQYQDTQVYLGANIQLDSLYESLKGEGGQAGIVRAQKKPIGLSF